MRLRSTSADTTVERRDDLSLLNPNATNTDARDRTPTVKLRGPFDRWGAVKLRFRLLLPLARGCKQIVLDLRRVPYVDSDGLKTLKSLQTDHADVHFEIANANRSVQRTLHLAMLDSLLKAS